MFQKNEVYKGIWHITDCMGVSFTMIEGEEKAVLFDTGYGMENVSDFTKTLTEKPVKVYLSHGHHDHMLGARWFEHTWICKEDINEFHERTGKLQRIKVCRQALGNGVKPPEDFLEFQMPEPEIISFSEITGKFESLTEKLGGIEINIIHVPGHTPGSIVVYVPVFNLLLTGDDWNPCTWMWFPTSMRADAWRENMTALISALEEITGNTIDKVLCSHQPVIREGNELKSFLAYMTDERMSIAPRVDMGAPIDTRQIVKNEWVLIFDGNKI